MPASSKDQQAWPASIFGFVTGVFNSLSAEKSPQTNSNEVVNAVVTIQKYWRGFIVRKLIIEQYGFKFSGFKGPVSN
jgi:hypothetical protein